jgi:hypothetical protein
LLLRGRVFKTLDNILTQILDSGFTGDLIVPVESINASLRGLI